VKARVGQSLGALRSVFANPDLRRVQIASLGANVGHFAYFLGISIYVFDAAGAAAVGVAAAARMVPMALATPFASTIGDRHSRSAVMVVSDLSRAAVLSLTAVAVLADMPVAVAVVLAGIAGVLYTPFQPAKSALIPDLARTPEELTAANLASSTIESASVFLGPLLAAAILGFSVPAVAIFVSAACLLWSALFVARVRSAPPEKKSDEAESSHFVVEALAGFRAIGTDRRLALVLGLFTAQTFVFGGLSVLSVVLALELLDIGNAGLGFLNAAEGIGALMGAGFALALVGNRRLARSLGIGVALWGLPMVVIGLFVHEGVALVMLAAIGIANTIVDVSALTLLQRIAPEEILARVFGVMETLLIASVALGSLLAPLLIELIGARGAFIAFGGLLPLLAIAAWGLLARVDASAPAPTRRLELLEAIPLFAPLDPVALEELAARLEDLRVNAGKEIVCQGEAGERFYVLAEGEVEVAVDGRRVGTEGAGAHFGEIALLRDVPRTATVTALTDAELFALDRADFIDAVTGNTPSSAAAEAIIGTRLARARPAALAGAEPA
jgi:MFS family permease